MAILIQILASERAGAPSSLARLAGQAIGEQWVLSAAAWPVNARVPVTTPLRDQVEEPAEDRQRKAQLRSR